MMINELKLVDEDVHVHIDLETMSTQSNAKILSIGAVAITLSGKTIGRFYTNVDTPEHMVEHFHVSPSTQDWWSTQPDQVREALNSDRIDLNEALIKFSEWVKNVGGTHAWGNGSDFDISITQRAFNVCSMEWPFAFWNHRCLRTLLDAAKIDKRDYDFIGEKHYALHDAEFQAMLCVEAYKKLNRKWWERFVFWRD